MATLIEELESIMDPLGLYPISYQGGHFLEGKGWDNAKVDENAEYKYSGVRNKYGEGWNDAIMKVHREVYELIEKYEKDEK